jgi:hypothetical protein
MKLPGLKVFYGDAEVPCRYDYDPGEEQWFDARQGVGSPGYPAEVSVTEVYVGGEWVDAGNFGIDQCKDWEQQIDDQLVEHFEAENAARDEAEYAAHEEMKLWEADKGLSQ